MPRCIRPLALRRKVALDGLRVSMGGRTVKEPQRQGIRALYGQLTAVRHLDPASYYGRRRAAERRDPFAAGRIQNLLGHHRVIGQAGWILLASSEGSSAGP